MAGKVTRSLQDAVLRLGGGRAGLHALLRHGRTGGWRGSGLAAVSKASETEKATYAVERRISFMVSGSLLEYLLADHMENIIGANMVAEVELSRCQHGGG